jgi:hypothetical protein
MRLILISSSGFIVNTTARIYIANLPDVNKMPKPAKYPLYTFAAGFLT